MYALAAVVVSAEVRRKGQDSARLVTPYQDRAVVLLREAIRRLPADRRASFVKEVILVDPDLRTLRRRLASPDLAGQVSAATSPPKDGGAGGLTAKPHRLERCRHVKPPGNVVVIGTRQ